MAFYWEYGQDENDVLCKNHEEFANLYFNDQVGVQNLFLDDIEEYKKLVYYSIEKYEKNDLVFSLLLTLTKVIEDQEIVNKVGTFIFEWAHKDRTAAQVEAGNIAKMIGEYENAINWLNEAANKNNIEAIELLVDLYENVEEVKSYNDAFYWSCKGSFLGDEHLMGHLGFLYLGNNDVKFDLEKSLKWLNEGESKGDTYCQALLGDIYFNGDYTRQNVDKAIEYYSKASENGDAYSEYKLAEIYFTYEEYKDNEKGKKYLIQSALNLYEPALIKVAYFSYEGIYMNQDFGISFECYKILHEQGNKNATNMLGVMYAKGEGVEKDKQKAYSYYLDAAKSGNDKAQFNLAIMYYNGDGVDVNYNEALKWASMARDNGNDEAKELCDEISNTLTEVLNDEIEKANKKINQERLKEIRLKLKSTFSKFERASEVRDYVEMKMRRFIGTNFYTNARCNEVYDDAMEDLKEDVRCKYESISLEINEYIDELEEINVDLSNSSFSNNDIENLAIGAGIGAGVQGTHGSCPR